MKPHSYSSEGIVLARRNYGEADRIISVYTKDHGRLSFMAKGIRRPKSRKRGHLEIFSYFRFQAITNRGLDLMTETEVIDDFKEIRNNLKKISLAYYFCEVLGKITHEGEANVRLFDLMLENLREIKKENKLKTLRLNFVKELLILLGYWPEGKVLQEVDKKLEEVIERNLSTPRIGKMMLE